MLFFHTAMFFTCISSDEQERLLQSTFYPTTQSPTCRTLPAGMPAQMPTRGSSSNSRCPFSTGLPSASSSRLGGGPPSAGASGAFSWRRRIGGGMQGGLLGSFRKRHGPMHATPCTHGAQL